MFILPLLFGAYFVHLAATLHISGGLFGYVFGFQRICFCPLGRMYSRHQIYRNGQGGHKYLNNASFVKAIKCLAGSTYLMATRVPTYAGYVGCGIPHRYLSEYSRAGRLLGGEATTAHQFPWLAAVNLASRSVGGSLISDRHVVTAASPLYGKSFNEISVTLGAHDRCGNGSDPALNTSVSDVIIHPGFSPTNRDNDIALLKLRHVVPFSRFISPICMPHYGAPESGQVAWTAAWTGTYANESCTPRVATLPILPTRSCLKGSEDSNLVTPDKGCLGPMGAKNIICEADVGAPIMQRSPGFSYRLAGVVSSSSCDHVTSPLYTRIIDHASWIHQHTHSDCQCL